MTTLFCIRPATRNIGNDIINKATADLLLAEFGTETSIVNVPALVGPQYGGLTPRQVYDINRLADGVVIGGGNLFENGQLTVDEQALDALRRPMLLIGLAHGRISDGDGSFVHRSDALPPRIIRRLVDASVRSLVRDRASQAILCSLQLPKVEVGGCPTMFMTANPPDVRDDGRVLLSVRHPGRMSVPPPLQWRTVEDVRALIRALTSRFGNVVSLVCHDYADLEFAAAFPEVPRCYFDSVDQYIDALRRCRLNVSYRLHAFLPCLAFGTPSIHLSYDERGRETVATAGMGEWDVDLLGEADAVGAVMDRAGQVERYHALRDRSAATVAALHRTTMAGLQAFAQAVTEP